MFILPDIVRDNFSGSAEITGSQAEGHYWLFPSEIKQAILGQDVANVRAAKEKHADDLKATLDLLKTKQKNAFKTVTNPSRKQGYQLCETDTGIMWTYPVNVQNADKKYKVTVAVGSFSKNANIIGISTTVFGWIPAQIAAAVVSSVAAEAVATFVAQRLAGVAFPAALAFVEALVASVLEAVGIAVWSPSSLSASWSSTLYPSLKKKFGLEVNIHNWSTMEEWVVTEWFGDNADIQDAKSATEPFQKVELPRITGKIVMPDGTNTASSDLITSYAAYTVINHNTWLEGVGIGLKVVSKAEPSQGKLMHSIYLKYVIHWRADNELNIGYTANSLSDFYEDEWAKAGTMSMQIEVPSKGGHPAIPVVALTPSLGGETSHMYTLDVHIGASASK
ncbi:hypothetical protein BDZ94DRAFT_1236707 [Collybia nuda]|uniref:Uncharacterized protein n=1 Tax=Collybia nuda TaxID=64659 RepID=A0A9P5Y3Q8_9AGAR|nr:hypothetical protein BDZ94DRAFT_1236707 [Collybia nuda]